MFEKYLRFKHLHLGSRLHNNIVAPAIIISASNFFALSVSVAISFFGLTFEAVVATVVGVLTEVPIMLTLVVIWNTTERYFDREGGING